MKLLLENWRKFLTEEAAEDKFNFGSIVIDEFLTDDSRHIVIVKTLDGPVAFYRSSGTGTGTWTKGMYLPFDGVSASGPGDASVFWFGKMDPSHPQSGNKSSKVPKEGSEFDKIGKYLSHKYGEGAGGQTAQQFMDTIGAITPEELSVEYFNGAPLNSIFGIPLYDAMAVNLFLKKWDALGRLGNNDYWGVDDIEWKGVVFKGADK
tara:strand:- start:108 stop:725 length:618 start_codon:yes stop_codon:yes gene_type:complete